MVARANADQPLDANLYAVFNSVVKVTLPNVGSGSGAHLKGTNYILTSAHVANVAPMNTTVTFSTLGSSITRSVTGFYVHPLFEADGRTPEYDIALLKISGTAPSWSSGYEIQTDPYVYGETVWVAGFGQQSLSGSIPREPTTIQKSWASNITDFVTKEAGDVSPLDWDERSREFSSNYLEDAVFNKVKDLVILDYDDGSGARNALKFDTDAGSSQRYGLFGIDGEGIPLPGDSGGPIINSRNEKILGITTAGARSYADPDWSRPGNFGEISLNVSPRQFSGWIKFITDEKPFKEIISFEKSITYSKNFNSYLGFGNNQKFRINVSNDYDSTTIFATSKDEFYIDTGTEYIQLKWIPTINVKFSESSFGYDVFFDGLSGKLKSTSAQKTPIPQTFDSYLQGTSANDSWKDSSSSNQRIEGGIGSDTFITSGALTEYNVEKQEAQVILRKYANDEVDVLVDIEKIYFSNNKVISFDHTQQAGKALRIYKAAFNRDPMKFDQGGLGFWITKMERGMDQLEVSARFVDSDEFRTLYGTNPSNAQFLTKLYQNVLGRAPEATGYNWWLNELNTNPSKNKAKVLADFAESSENQAGVASLIGNGITYEPWVG
jgi:hypothetical protein